MGIIQRQGIRNSIITYTGILLGAISLIIIQPRFLTKEEIGLTRILYSFAVLIASFAPLGMTATVTRYFPYFRDRERQHHGFFGFMLIFPLLGYIVIAGLIFLFREQIMVYYGQSKLFTDYFFYVFPLIFFASFISVLTAYSYSIFRTSVPVLINDILVRLGSIVVFTLYHIHMMDRDGLVFYFVMVYGIQLVLLVGYLFYEDRPSLRIRWEQYKVHTPVTMFKYGLIVSLTGISSIGLRYMDSLMLGMYKPQQANLNALDIVGIYSIAAFIATFVEAPMNAIDKIIVPKYADGWKNKDYADIRQIYYKSAKYLLLIGGLLFLLINLNIDSLFMLIPDHDYSLAKGVVLIISIGTLINMGTGNTDGYLLTSTKYKLLTWLLVGLLGVAYINYRILIPLFGMYGAALATATSATVYNFAKYFIIWRYYKMQPFNLDTIKIILTIVVTGGICYFIPSFGNPFMDIPVKGSIISVLFVGLAYALRIVPEFHHLIPFIGKKK
ncbi:MAG: polysaccharide biosynthesis C-terminal domain-containing protein [Bacteroidetes bacterium]|nr:polysaccharide biosynthesis C-terminal domain-containing protein [Bacteroidota bacterium]